MSRATGDSWSGNAGDWGEAFVLLHLMGDNVLYNADEHGRRVDSERSQVKAIYRTETSGRDLAFVVVEGLDEGRDGGDVLVMEDGERVEIIPQSEFAEAAHSLFGRITKEGRGEHPEQQFLKRIGCEGIKAASTQKADLRARVVDGFIGSQVVRNYSIKTVLRGDPALSNASGGSYIRYELIGFDQAKADEVNSITKESCKDWVVARTKKCLELADGVVPSVDERIFERNLLKCHWREVEALGHVLLYGQTIKGKRIPEAIKAATAANPAGWPEDELCDYEDAVRKYLWAVVFDMTPAKPWVGPAQVDGYLLVNRNEEVLAYQVSRQRSFENYLLAHTAFDTPSTSRHGKVGRVVNNGGKWVYSLSCSVRYKAKEYEGDFEIFG